MAESEHPPDNIGAAIDKMVAETERNDAVLAQIDDLKRRLDEQQRISHRFTIRVALLASALNSALWSVSFLFNFVDNLSLRSAWAFATFVILSIVFSALTLVFYKPVITRLRDSLTRLARRFKP